MAIGFARIEFIKRSEGRNCCQLSAYLSRSRIYFEGNCALEPQLYDFTHRENVSSEEIILPEGVNENFKIAEVLWNAAEKKEVRKDAQVSMHLVLALPDDKEITLADRIELTRSYIQKHYVDKGLGAQFVVHPPERKIEFTQNNETFGIKKGTIGTVLKEKEGNYIVALPKDARANPIIEIGVKCPGIAEHEHNWHAHAQITTRRFKGNGNELEDLKATDLMPTVKKGKVISGPDNGRLWAQHQNDFFLSKGFALRVDENGLIAQEHLGPVRMRARAFDLLAEHERRLDLNSIAASDPRNILEAITKKQSVFTKEDVERFMLKHVPGDKIQRVREGFWQLEELVQLRAKDSKVFVSKFSSKSVIEEEKQILRLADRIHQKSPRDISEKIIKQFTSSLSKEQIKAYRNILDGNSLSCIQGYAGTGKSYLLKALKDAYEERGLFVRSFGPDNATANVLKGKGFPDSENVYRFLFSAKHGFRNFHKGFEVWILDEAGKLGNKPLLEFLKLAEAKRAKVILAGDSAQLPPVERGGVFKAFCERYGSEVLEEVLRQKEEAQRAMVKNLAQGEIGNALDKLSDQQSIQWTLTRKDAMEALVLKWASDHRPSSKTSPALGKDSTLIVTGTNAEVRVLNEMVRLIRKERGEISTREFACETAHGTIYVSEGDRIEFRKNHRELGVTNGMSGTLMQAEKGRFVVAIQEDGKKTRMLSFNPEEYHHFQLGYASTCSRAQGRTVDHAYVMHTPYLNKQMAYVGLTRHVKDVHYFVPREEVASLSDLKRKALRDGSKLTTLEYTHSQDLHFQTVRKERESEIQKLKEADQFSLRFRAAALEAWGHLKGKTHELMERRYDRKPNQDFFNFKDERAERIKGMVREVTQEELKRLSVESVDPEDKASFKEVARKIALQDQSLTKSEEGIKIQVKAKEIEKDLYENFSSANSHKSFKENSVFWKELSKESKKLLSAYYTAASKASELKEVVQAEYAGNLEDATQCERFKEWQKACAQRNEAAFHLKGGFSNEEFGGIFNHKAAYFVEIHASKHEEILKAQEQRALQAEKMKNLEGQLCYHIEPLLYKLFPDGPSSKTSRGFRFGSKGALSVTHNGPEAGKFYDFERQEGGGLLKLVQREMGLDKNESRDWALEFLGIASEIKIPQTFIKPAAQKIQSESEWVSLKADSNISAPKFEKIGNLHHYYNEVMRHDYRDQDGNLLYHVLRLQDKNDPSRKITPPLSYGQYNGDEPSWQLKGYKDVSGKAQLYGLEKLKTNPNAIVVVVEGEKAADLGADKFKNRDVICVSWPGGSGAVSRADWSPLQGRRVVMWGDNDTPGRKAQDEVCKELQKLDPIAVRAVDQKELAKYAPEKWDLGDEIPESFGKYTLDALLECGERVKGNFLEIHREMGKQKQFEIEM